MNCCRLAVRITKLVQLQKLPFTNAIHRLDNNNNDNNNNNGEDYGNDNYDKEDVVVALLFIPEVRGETGTDRSPG